MKILHTLIIVFFLVLAHALPAQVQINLSVDANPSPRISDWVNRDEVAILTVTNANPALEGTPYKIRMRLLLDGNLVAETHMPSVPARNLVLGTEVFLADEVIPYQAVRLYGNHERTVMQTGMLPAGHYTFCVSLVDLSNSVISMPAEVCRNMFITAYQAPELIFPARGSTIDGMSLQSTQFVWSPMTPAPPRGMGVKYVVVITEVQPRQTPSQAFFVNYPLVEEEVIGTTRMLWPPDIDLPADETQYVWGVKAVSFDDEPYLADNAGFSSFSSFTVIPDTFDPKTGEEEVEEEAEEDPEGEEEEIEPPAPGEGTLAETDTIFAGQDGEFIVIASNISESNGTFSGEGNVFIDWLNANVAVSFESITVDDDNHLVTGKIITVVDENAPVYPLEWGAQAAANFMFSHLEADAISLWTDNVPGQLLPYLNPNEVLQPLQMPLGFNWTGGSQVAITEMVFRADKSEFNAVAALSLPYDMSTQRLGFLAKSIKFHPGSIQLPMERLELVEDFNIGNVNNNIVFQFKQPDANNLGCYIEWDDDGFSEFGLQISALFTRDWLLPVPDNDPSAKVSASLSVQGTNWDELILGGTMDQAEIVDSGGMTILADSIYYDLSDVLNPPGIVFPENYPGDTSTLFRGFYMNEFELVLPESWQTNTGGQPTINVQNMIINSTGLTMKALATNVLGFPNAEVADLYASIDTVHVDMVASSLVEAGIKGRIGLPISKKDSIPNPLEYTALFNNPISPNESFSFQLAISPTGPIPAHMLKGELELAQTSNIIAYIDEVESSFDINLDGTFNWASVDLGPVKDVQLNLAFQGLGMTYNSLANTPFSFNIGSWAFASEQKYLANFPVTIQNIGFTTLSSQQNQLIRGTINFDVIFNLNEDIGGMAGLGVEMAILDNVQGQKFYPEYINTSMDSIYIQANMAAVSIEGALGIRNEDPVFGNGFIGTLSADIKPTNIQVSALAEFGNTTYQNGNQLYRYWRVEADVTLPAPGVAFLPGLAFRGFGGAAYNNMEASLAGTSYTFSPLKSQLGFQAKASLATTPSEEGFNADATLAGEFNTNTGGLTFINFTGDFWVGAEMNSQSRAEAIVSGDLGVTYDFPQKHFNLFANVDVNSPPISTPNQVGLVLDINGTNNQWFFKFGEPAVPNNVSIFGVSLYAYLMFGNTIPFPTGFTPGFSSAYESAVGQPPGGNIGQGGVGPHTNTGSGFATGLGFMFDHNDEFEVNNPLSAGDWFLGYDLGAGAELHLAFMNYVGSCSGYNPIGINGWRASGGLGFYATASAYARREGGLFGDNEWELASLAAGAWIYGEFPNPYYAAGAVSGHAKLCGLINLHFHREFEVGTACTNAPAGTSLTVTSGDVAADQQNKLVQYVNPINTYNFPTDAPLAVKYGLEPDEVFDVAEQQADGTIILRSFKMEKSASLQEEQQNGSWSPKLMNQTTNVLGEHLYTTIQQAAGLDGGFAPAGPVGNIGGGSGAAGSTGSAPPHLGPSGGAIFNLIGLGGVAAAPNLTGGTGGGQAGGGPGTAPGLDMSNMPLLPYPPQPTPPNYGNLPPTSGPPVNNLEEDTSYIFTVTATLKEYINGSWTDALTKEGDPVTQTVVKNFSTGDIPTVVPGGSGLQTF